MIVLASQIWRSNNLGKRMIAKAVEISPRFQSMALSCVLRWLQLPGMETPVFARCSLSPCDPISAVVPFSFSFSFSWHLSQG